MGGNSPLAGTPDGLAGPAAFTFNVGTGAGKGAYDFTADTVKGLWNTVAHPIDTGKSLVHAVTHPIDTYNIFKDAIQTSYQRDMVDGDAESRTRWLTYAGGTIVASVLGTKGADKVSKVGTTAAKTTVSQSKVALNNINHRTPNLFSLGPKYELAPVGPVPYNVIDSGNLKDQMIMAAKKSSEAKSIKSSGSVISKVDRAKLANWGRPPSDKLYLANKHIYDNPKFFDQKSGNPIYPGTQRVDPNNPDKKIKDPNTDGFINGKYDSQTISKGTVIDRYGDNGSGQYFSPDGSSYESRALPPFMKDKPHERFEIIREFEVKTGEVAPWFGERGKGIQHYTDAHIKDDYGNLVKANVENLLRYEYLIKID